MMRLPVKSRGRLRRIGGAARTSALPHTTIYSHALTTRIRRRLRSRRDVQSASTTKRIRCFFTKLTSRRVGCISATRHRLHTAGAHPVVDISLIAIRRDRGPIEAASIQDQCSGSSKLDHLSSPFPSRAPHPDCMLYEHFDFVRLPTNRSR